MKVKILSKRYGLQDDWEFDDVPEAIEFLETPTDDCYAYGAVLENGERFEDPEPIGGGPSAVAKWLKSKTA